MIRNTAQNYLISRWYSCRDFTLGLPFLYIAIPSAAALALTRNRSEYPQVKHYEGFPLPEDSPLLPYLVRWSSHGDESLWLS